MNKGSIVERLCSDLDRKEPRYKSPTLLYFQGKLFVRPLSIPDIKLRTKFVDSIAQDVVFEILCSKHIGVTSLTFQGQVTSSVTGPFDSPCAISYW